MERAEWLKQMRGKAEALYDLCAPLYWRSFGFYDEEDHNEYLQKFLERAGSPGRILSAGCGAGRFDGRLIEAGHSVVGTDQSAGMLAQAREHFPVEQFPQLRYEKMGFQELPFQAEFDGVICMDALEHVCPEDYPVALRKFAEALKPGGWLYFTVDTQPGLDIEDAYQRARELGLPVVLGEVVDRLDWAFDQILAAPTPESQHARLVEIGDSAVYHFYPALDQVRAWLAQAGMTVVEEGMGSEYYHFIAQKK